MAKCSKKWLGFSKFLRTPTLENPCQITFTIKTYYQMYHQQSARSEEVKWKNMSSGKIGKVTLLATATNAKNENILFCHETSKNIAHINYRKHKRTTRNVKL